MATQNEQYQKAKDIFLEKFERKNFITPKIIKYGIRGIYAYELSFGEFMGEDIYGVTVIDTQDTEHRTELSKSFSKQSEAMKYIRGLK